MEVELAGEDKKRVFDGALGRHERGFLKKDVFISSDFSVVAVFVK